MYVDQLEDANGGTIHELAEDITTVYTTLVWNAAEGKWAPVEPIELHTTCRTAPIAPVYKQLKSYQIKVWGDIAGKETAHTFSIPENGYTLSEVRGSREEGFYVDMTVTLEDGDYYHTSWVEKKNPGVTYKYDWERTPETITVTLRYNGDLNGTLHGDRHASNTNYDWVLDTTGKTFGVVAEAYLQRMEFTVSFNSNGGKAIEPITVTYDSAYGKLPSASSVTGFTNPKNSWYLIDAEGNVTETNIRNTTIVSEARDHELIQKREIYVSAVKVARTPAGQYVGTEYTLTATVANLNEELLDYTYAWYKDGVLVEGATEATLVLKGNYSDNGEYKAVVTATKKADCTIVTWNDSASNEGTYTLKLSKIANTLRLNENYGENPATSDSYSGGSSAVIRSAAERTGYTFLGWNTAADGSGTMYQKGDTVEFVDEVGNGGIIVELFAQWKANEYTVTLDPNGGEVAPATVTVTYDSAISELPEAVRTGYTFAGWTTEDGTPVDAQTIYTVAGDSTFVAMWTANEYTITFDANGGKVDPATKVVVFDAKVGELPVPERYGYTFAGWTTADGDPVDAETVYTVAGDSTYVAMWTKNIYTVTFDAKGGYCEETSRQVPYLDAVGELPYAYYAGYAFVGWYDENGKEVDEEYVVTGNVTLTAKFVRGIVIDMDGNGNVTGADKTENESNPNTGAPAAANLVSAIAVLSAAAYVLGKRK